MSKHGILFGLAAVTMLATCDYQCAKHNAKKAQAAPVDTSDTSAAAHRLEQAMQAYGEQAQIEAQQDLDTAQAMMSRFLETDTSISDQDLSALQFQMWEEARVNNTLARMQDQPS